MSKKPQGFTLRTGTKEMVIIPFYKVAMVKATDQGISIVLEGDHLFDEHNWYPWNKLLNESTVTDQLARYLDPIDDGVIYSDWSEHI